MPGAMLAGLRNDVHKRYLHMNGHHDKMDGSPKPLVPFRDWGRCRSQHLLCLSMARLGKMTDVPRGWTWELFRAGA